MTLRRTATAILLAVLFTLGATGPADAQSSQLNDMVQGPELQESDRPTVAERYDITSYRYPFHGDAVGLGSRADEGVDQMLNAVASFVLSIAAWLARSASAVMQWAFDPAMTAWLLDGVEAVFTALASTVYGQIIGAVVFLGVVWVAWQGIVRRSVTGATGGLVWMVFLIAVGVLFIDNPRWFVETPHEAATTVSAELFGSVASVGAGGSGGYHGDRPPTFSGPASVDAQRRVQDQLWRVMVHEPWLASTFPTRESADEHGEALLADRGEATVADIHDQIAADGDQQAADFFAGREPGDRLAWSLLTLLAAIPVAVTMIVLGASLIVLSYAFVILSLLGVLFLLIGIHPGGGQRAAWGWFEMWAGVLVKRIAVTALISVLMAMFAFSAENLSQAGWFQTVLTTTLVCVAALIYRKPIVGLLASAFGRFGSGREGEREHAARAHPGRTTARTVAAAKIGGLAGLAASAGRRATRPIKEGRPDNDDTPSPDGEGGTSATRRRATAQAHGQTTVGGREHRPPTSSEDRTSDTGRHRGETTEPDPLRRAGSTRHTPDGGGTDDWRQRKLDDWVEHVRNTGYYRDSPDAGDRAIDSEAKELGRTPTSERERVRRGDDQPETAAAKTDGGRRAAPEPSNGRDGKWDRDGNFHPARSSDSGSEGRRYHWTPTDKGDPPPSSERRPGDDDGEPAVRPKAGPVQHRSDRRRKGDPS